MWYVLVREEKRDGRIIHLCDCGLGYDDVLIAFACEEYMRENGFNSEEITKHAIYNPRSEPRTKVIHRTT